MMKQEWLKARLQPRLQQCKRAAGFVRSPANSVFLRRGLRQAAGCQRKKGSKKNSGGCKCKTWNLEPLLSIIYSASERLHSGSGLFPGRYFIALLFFLTLFGGTAAAQQL